jgi:Right handed beta helix region
VLCVLALPELVINRALSQSTATFNFYISATGSDTNPGTQASPWAITSLRDTSPNNSKMAGKKVGLLPGTYAVASLTSGSDPVDYQHPVLHIPAGAAGNPTVVQSVTPRAAILNYSSSLNVNSCIGQDPGGSGHWTLDGVVINATGYNGSPVSYFPGGGNSGATIQNCEIYGVAGTIFGDNYAGIFQQAANGSLIQNNYFHDIHKPSQPDHCHAFEEYGCTSTQFLYNTIMNCDTGIDGKVNDNNCTIAYNYFYNCPTGTIQGYDGDQNSTEAVNTFHHNVIDSCGWQKLIDVSSICAQPVVWYNNTAHDSRSGSPTTIDLRTSVANSVKFYNNICVMTSTSGGPSDGSVAFSSGTIATCDYNCYFFNNYTNGWGQGSLYSSLAAWRASRGNPDTHGLTSNPQFSSAIVPGAGPTQFQLAGTYGHSGSSPCVGVGQGGGNIGAWDGTVSQIGCNFLSGATPSAPTLSVS